MRLSLSDEARADARQIADWYIDQDARGAAEAFHLQLQHTLLRLQQAPGLGTPAPGGTRILPVHHFPVSVVYRVQGDDLRVLAIAAQRRQPGFWHGRR